MEYLGFVVGNHWWKPSEKKVESILSAKVNNLASLRSFLGAANFLRRHVKNFTFSSAILTNLLKHTQRWEWTPEHEQAFQELKGKIAVAKGLGVPQLKGEILLVTDSSNLGGGASLYQWQCISLLIDKTPEFQNFSTQGVNKDGTLKHNYNEEEWRLVPLGFYNWKWNEARSRYGTYEQELLSGILTLARQVRILGHLPIVWLCDQQATSIFMKNPPPGRPRLTRWWIFLTQFKLNIVHVPGAKNELCDFLSRHNFNERLQIDIEEQAKSAFQRMDVQLDLRLEALPFDPKEYENDPHLSQAWNALTTGKSQMFDTNMFWRTEDKLFCEKKLCIPDSQIPSFILQVHTKMGHPGAERTLWHFLQRFHVPLKAKQLLSVIVPVISPCKVHCESKPNTASDRGLVGALPILNLFNETLYVDLISVDEPHMIMSQRW